MNAPSNQEIGAITAQLAELTRIQDEALIKLLADHADGLDDNAIIVHNLAIAHDEASGINAQRDIAAMLKSYEREDLSRCTATAQAMLTNGRSLMMDDAETAPGVIDDEPTDREIIENYVASFGGTNEQALIRMTKMVMMVLNVVTV